jgi:colanic acid/amylovoran biosynthesis protein
MKILLVNQKTSLNRGDMAIYNETLRLLRRSFPESCIVMTLRGREEENSFPDCTIINSLESWVVSVDSSGQEKFTSPLQRIVDIIRLMFFVIYYRMSGRKIRCFFDYKKQAFLDACASADFVLGCGGGYLYDEYDSPQSVFSELIRLFAWDMFVLGEMLVPLAIGKPLVLLPQSIGPLRTRLKKHIISWIVRKANLTFVRERESLYLLQKLGCSQRAMYMPDLAFGLPEGDRELAEILLKRAGLDRARYSFCVGITAIDWGAQQRGFYRQAMYEQSLVACIDEITCQGGAVVLFAQCATLLPAWNDRIVNRRLKAAARDPQHVYLVEDLPEPEQLQSLYGLMNYFVATRMHSAILAMNAGVPVITIGYLHKSRGIMREANLAEWCFDIGTVTPGELVRGFHRLRLLTVQDQAQKYVAFAVRSKKALVVLLQLVIERRAYCVH